MQEIWKDIKGYEGKYQVSNLGNVKAVHYHNGGKEKLLKRGNTRGYLTVVLCKNGQMKTYRVHRLVAETFISNPNNLPCVNHKDENTLNNNANNLEWCTEKYNNNYGTKKARISETLRQNNLGKPILQYDLRGNFIKQWKNAREIERVLGISNGNICSCCKGNRRSTGGYLWRYREG